MHIQSTFLSNNSPVKIYPHVILSFRNTKGDILQNYHAALFHILKTWLLPVKLLKGQKCFIKVVHTTYALYSRANVFGRPWGWVNDDQQVIFLRKNMCFGFMVFPKAQHMAQTQLSLQYYGLREPPVWYSLKRLQTLSLPVWTSVLQLGWYTLVDVLCFYLPRNILMTCSVTINNSFARKQAFASLRWALNHKWSSRCRKAIDWLYKTTVNI